MNFAAHDRKFRLHFNRVNMQRRNPAIWTIHLSDRCIPVEEVEVGVPVRTVFRGFDARQPRAWLEGRVLIGDARARFDADHAKAVLEKALELEGK